MDSQQIHAIVRERYARAAARAGCGCADPAQLGYEPGSLAEVPDDLRDSSLGCGNPLSRAELKTGERVLDLGSGAGLDVSLAARAVGPAGRVYGVDFTPEMIERAREHLGRQGIANVTLLQSRIDDLPLPDDSVDVVTSNCVINLAPDKPSVFREAFRVLAPGGRLVVSDILASAPIPESVREDAGAWASCIAGAIPERDYLEAIRAAGFENVRAIHGGAFDLSRLEAPGSTAATSCCGGGGCCGGGELQLMSATVLASKPTAGPTG